MIEMKVKGISVDQTGDFLVLLVDHEETKVLPVSIGKLEAQSILMPMEGIEPPRPMTHDLFKVAIEELGAKLEKVVITKIENSTYYAEIYMRQDERNIVLDSRPSDAIALALRCDAPIFIKFPLIEFTYDFSDIKFI